MNLRPLLLPLLACAWPVLAQQPSAAPPSPEQQKFQQLIVEVQQLHGRGRHFEALQKLNDAESLFPDSPIVHNMRGSVHTGMRAFDKARECFEQSAKLSPDAFEPKFNLTELDYVQGRYAEAEKSFARLLADYPKLPLQVRHLTQFKLLVCRLKMDDAPGAEVMLKNFTFMDDTAAYYYSKAAFAFQKNDKSQAANWLAKADKIFKPIEKAPYLDTLMEARWVESVGVPAEPGK